MTRTLLAALAFLPIAPSPARAAAPQWTPAVPETLEAPLSTDPLRTTIHRLSNGMTVYLSPNPEQPRIAAWISVRAGSKHDPAEHTGMAHYLEHMLFKGSPALGTLDYAAERGHLERIAELYEKHFAAKDPAERLNIYKEIDAENQKASKLSSPNEISRIYKQMGFRGLNAFTGDEQTVYICDLPSNRLEAWARVEAERLAKPVFRLFVGEIETVYEEKNRSLDHPEIPLIEALNRALYKAHPYGQQTTIGTIEHLKNPSVARMEAYYRRHYVPGNMAISLSGDFERGKVLPLLERTFGAWKPRPIPEPKAWPLPAPKGVERVEVKYEAEEKVIVAWQGVPRRHPDADAFLVLDMLMDNPAGIVSLNLLQTQKVKEASTGLSLNNDAGDWAIWAVPKLGQTLEEAEALLMETVGRLKAGQFTEEDLKAVIVNYEVHEKGRLESNEARVSLMSASFTHFEPWPETVERLARLRRVAKSDVVRVANKYLGSDRVVATRRRGKPEIPSIAKPPITGIQIDPSRLSRFAREILNLPTVPPEPKWLMAGRDYEIADLPFGKLFAAPNPVNDLFSLSFELRAGRRHERKLCAALALLDLAGAGAMSAEEYKKRLYRLGTSVDYSCGEQESGFSISGLNENLWPSLELLLARFESPNVSTDTLAKMVEIAIGAHQDNKKDPDYIYHALGEYARQGKESSVLLELSDPELKKLTIGPLKNLIRGLPKHKRRVAYVGNRPPGEIAKLLESSEPAKAPPGRRPVRYQKPPRTKVYFAHRDMVQAQVGLFAADGILDTEKIVDYAFYGSYMGGGMSSVIFQEIREARALAYASWGGYGFADFAGDENLVYGGLGCQADKTVEGSSLLHKLFLSPPFDETRFRETAKAIEENYRTNPIRFRAVPGALMGWEDQGITGGDPRPKRFERALKYRLEDLKGFAERLKGRPMTLYILGDRGRVALDEVRKMGDFEEKTLEQVFPY